MLLYSMCRLIPTTTAGPLGPLSFFNTHAKELYTDDFSVASDKKYSRRAVTDHLLRSSGSGTLNRMLYVDTKTWLPDDLLVKADKITMANSIELRVPLLDHRLLEFAASLPENFKVHGFTTKYLAKRALAKKVPREVIERKKTGFPVPYESWLNGPLKSWLHQVLLDREDAFARIFQEECHRKTAGGKWAFRSILKELFSLAVLELWHRTFLGSPGSVPTPVSANSEKTAPSAPRLWMRLVR